MFGQTSTFGSPPAANASPFGQQQQQQSGGGFGFGTTNTTNSSPFGAPAPSTGFGGFGQQTQQNTTSGFGTSTTSTPFGSPPAANTGGGLFGAPAPASGFGTSSAFGAPSPAPTGGLFGAPAPAPTGGLFGSPAPAPTGGLFGAPSPAPATGGLFGAPSPAPAFGGSTFGAAPAPTTGGLFGAPSPAPSAFGGGFGSTSTTSAFGSASTSSPFGVSTGQANVTSKTANYQVTESLDGTTRVRLQSITAQPAFQNVSFEELRVADYLSGNRGSGAVVSSGGLFGAPAPAPTGGLFGSSTPAPAPAFGFGASNNSATTSAFGAKAPAPAFGFGSTPAAAPAFGAAPAPSGGLFGAPAPAPTGGLFGAPAPAPSGGLFGAPAPAPTGLFGAPAPAAPAPAFGGFGSTPAAAPAPSGGLFGAPAPAPSGGLFGAPAPAPSGGLFGAPAPAPSGGLFGAPAPAPAGGLFGAPAPANSGGLFGAPAPAAKGGLFGAPAPAPTGGLFGSTAKPPAGGLFGSPAPAPTGGLFGSPAPASGGLFGTAPAATPGPGLFGSSATAVPPATAPPTADQMLEQKLALIEHQRQENAKLEPWRTASSKSSSALQEGKTEPKSTSAATMYRATPMHTRAIAIPKSLAKIRPRGYTPSSTTKATSSSSALTTGRYAQLTSPSTPLTTPGIKNLAIRANVFTGTPKVKHRIHYLTNGSDDAIATPAKQEDQRQIKGGFSSPQPVSANRESIDRYQSVTTPPAPTGQATVEAPEVVSKKFVPVLTKPKYTVSPSIDDMETMSEADLANVPNFTVKHEKHGSIMWEGAVDVRGVNIDHTVVISAKEAVVYGKEEEMGSKPDLGTKLNRPAIITLTNIFPKEGSDPEKYKIKITRVTHKMGAKMINYDVDTGVWEFRVEHFSRYGLDDDDDDEEEVDENIDPQQNKILPWDQVVQSSTSNDFFKPMNKFQTVSPRKKQSLTHVMPSFGISSLDKLDEDQDEDMVVIEEPMDVDREEDLVQAADAAFGALTEIEEKNYQEHQKLEQEKIIQLPYDDDSDTDDKASSESFQRIVLPTAEIISSSESICSQIASKANAPMRPNRHFRVGWAPNNKIFTIRDRTKIVIINPKIKMEKESSEPSMLEHIKHSKIHKTKVSDSPCVLRSLPCGFQRREYVDVCKTVDGYSDISNAPSTAYQLVKALYGQEKSFVDSDNIHDDPMILPVEENRGDAFNFAQFRRRRDAILSSLKLSLCKSQFQKYPILNALCFNDSVTASDYAMSKGYFHLATILSNYRESANEDMKSQINLWKQTGYFDTFEEEEIRRVYMILGGDLSLEKQLCVKSVRNALSWQSRLALMISQAEGLDLNQILANYDDEVKSGTVPVPCFESLDKQESTIYRILKLRATFGGRDGSTTLSHVILPTGYSTNRHDYTMSWHLNQILSSLGVAALSSKQHIQLCESMVAQMIYSKKYHWAIYVALCLSNGLLSSTPELSIVHEYFAKVLIQRYAHKLEKSEHLWLVNEVGVQTEWFQESIAVHAGYNGEEVKHTSALAKAGLFDACARATRALLIPQGIIQGGNDEARLNDLLIQFAENLKDDTKSVFWSDVNGCGVALEILQAEKRLHDYLNGSLEFNEDVIYEDMETIEQLKTHIVDPGHKSTTMWAPYLGCSSKQNKADDTASIIILIERLSVIQSKLNILLNLSFDEQQKLKLSQMTKSQLAGIECRQYGSHSFKSSDHDQLRGMSGYLLS